MDQTIDGLDQEIMNGLDETEDSLPFEQAVAQTKH